MMNLIIAPAPAYRVPHAIVSTDDGHTIFGVYTKGRDWEGRVVWNWQVEAHGIGHFTGSGLCSGVGAEPDPREGLDSLLVFASAAGESWPDGENADLFPPALAEHFASISDDLAMLAMEVNPEAHGL